VTDLPSSAGASLGSPHLRRAPFGASAGFAGRKF